MKKFVSVFLVLTVLAAVCATAFAAPVTVAAMQPVAATPIDEQIRLINANLPSLSRDTESEQWKYAVTDLDRNGRLELVAAGIEEGTYSTMAEIYEVGEDSNSFVQCDMGVEEGKAFVDIISDSADTYYDKKTDTWYYIFTEGYAENENKFYSVKCSVSMKNDYVTPKAYAYESVEEDGDLLVITFSDLDGNIITPEEFNDAGNQVFKGCTKSCTAFDWFTFDEAVTVSRLTESYEIFAGLREPTKIHESFLLSIQAPAAASPTPTAAPDPGPKYLVITKNPTSEYRKEGDTAIFISTANNAESIVWTFVSPDGKTYSAQDFEYKFIQCDVSGERTFTLSVKNVCKAMDGWGAYCTFSGNGQTARSSTAYICVSEKPKPVVYNSTSGSYNASGSDNYAVAIYVPMVGTTLYVSPSIVKYDGTPYDGCPCTVYYTGDYPSGNSGGSIYQVDVYGSTEPIYVPTPEPAPEPEPEPPFTPVYPEVWECTACGTINGEYDVYCSNCGMSRSGTGSIEDVLDY